MITFGLVSKLENFKAARTIPCSPVGVLLPVDVCLVFREDGVAGELCVSSKLRCAPKTGVGGVPGSACIRANHTFLSFPTLTCVHHGIGSSFRNYTLPCRTHLAGEHFPQREYLAKCAHAQWLTRYEQNTLRQCVLVDVG